MGIESATYVGDLDAANPLAADSPATWDDHIRLMVKSLSKAEMDTVQRAYRTYKATADEVLR